MLTLEIDNGVKYRFPNLIRNPSPECKYFLLAYVEEGVEVWGSNAKWGCTSELMAYLELISPHWRGVARIGYGDKIYETRGFRKIDPSKYLVRDCPFHSTNPNEALPIGMMGNTYCDKCMG
jgi:hypothetical protein